MIPQNNIFNFSIFTSIFIHCFIVFAPAWGFYDKQSKSPVEEIKIEYIHDEPKIEIKKIPEIKKEFSPPKIDIQRKMPTLKKVQEKKEQAVSMAKPVQEPKEIKKEGETANETEVSLTDNPAYMNYYEILREKIRYNAFKYYNRRDTGKIRVVFKVNSTGALLESSITSEGEKSSYLEELVRQSLKRSVPFPEFPEGLKEEYKTLKLNVTVYFKSR